MVGQTLTTSNTLPIPTASRPSPTNGTATLSIVLGDAIKNGLNGVNGLDGSNCMSISLDGKHAYVTARSENAVTQYDETQARGVLEEF